MTARKPGNQLQFNHSVKVLEKFEVALDTLDIGRVEKAKEALKENTSLVSILILRAFHEMIKRALLDFFL